MKIISFIFCNHLQNREHEIKQKKDILKKFAKLIESYEFLKICLKRSAINTITYNY